MVEGDHQAGQIEGGKARSATQIQQALTGTKTSPMPTGQGMIAPDGVLVFQPPQFQVCGAETIAAP
ncbi:MAG: hypothetical protein ACKO21_14955 [Nodosilinea sp.]